MKFFSLATALLALTAIVSAQDVEKRLIDVSDTELDVKEVHNKPDVDTFVVTVQRTDDLLADDGTFLAERVMAVAFDFDVQDHEVLINKVPLGLESQPEEPISVTMTVEAGVIVGPALDPETKVEDLMNAFDTGLVTVQVSASTEFVTTDDGSVVRRVTLQETIVEVNGHEIVQTDAAQQVLEIMADGSLGSYTPLPFGKSGCQTRFNEAVKSVEEWFHSLNWPAFLCAGVIAFAMFIVSATTLRSLVQKRRQARYAKIHQEEVSEEFIQVAIIDDKKLDDEKKALVQ
ncbi:hypothetical protein BGZ80_004999 [Entomortierella chlamydospora]|uniref:Increased recombination centers protein 22 n=1 Tax=Entomortierella chlamydospora TaxID=101097 RepID=A0A9P6SW06_9FUNG|nr:hypothetical protein BGZ79_009298 [Entomortierella chlamydospora]KAG0007155.1 hypothetical protein BGZ80_004999 [Entomortierella chlamydospora]